MPYPKTETEIKKAKFRLEAHLQRLVKEFELENSARIEKLTIHRHDQQPNIFVVTASIQIDAIADEAQIRTAEVGA